MSPISSEPLLVSTPRWIATRQQFPDLPMSNLPELHTQRALQLSRRTVTLAACLGLSAAILGMAMPAAPSAAADYQEIAQALRAGGLVIVVRHGATFADQADTDPLNFDNIAAQRNLNDKGQDSRQGVWGRFARGWRSCGRGLHEQIQSCV